MLRPLDFVVLCALWNEQNIVLPWFLLIFFSSILRMYEVKQLPQRPKVNSTLISYLLDLQSRLLIGGCFPKWVGISTPWASRSLLLTWRMYRTTLGEERVTIIHPRKATCDSFLEMPWENTCTCHLHLLPCQNFLASLGDYLLNRTWWVSSYPIICTKTPGKNHDSLAAGFAARIRCW